MSRFAAIETRATQYPASTNDVVWLVTRVHDLREALLGCSRGPESDNCFCEMAIGNPMYHHHTSHCQRARAALEALEEPNLPVD